MKKDKPSLTLRQKRCNHMIGLDFYPYEGYDPVQADDERQPNDTTFEFCPKCGLKLETDYTAR